MFDYLLVLLGIGIIFAPQLFEAAYGIFGFFGERATSALSVTRRAS